MKGFSLKYESCAFPTDQLIFNYGTLLLEILFFFGAFSMLFIIELKDEAALRWLWQQSSLRST